MKPHQSMSALVTGGTGFVGSHVVRRLLADGYRLHLLHRPQSDFWRLRDVLPQCELHLGDLEDAARLHEIMVATAPEFIFHLASATMVAGSHAANQNMVLANVGGTVNLIDACAGIDYRGLVLTGDSFEYAPGAAAFKETDAAGPMNLHGITKLAGTLYGQAIAAAQSRPIVTLRMFSAYGPGDNPRRLIPRAISNALAGRPLTLSDPALTRDWTYVADVANLYMEAAQNAARLSGKVFNAGTGIATDLATLAALILKLTGSKAQAEWGVFPAPPHDQYPWVADPQSTFANFDWRPETDLETGLRATIASLLASH
jgi:nucleoside-diphosphate-sugar epimerase